MKFPVEEVARREAKEGEKEKRTLVVGIKMDGGSKELLTWTLMKVAQSGDQIIALHVLPSAAEVPDSDGKLSCFISLAKAFDAVLAVYEGFCNLKQIHLKLKLSRGSSIRRTLVQEASTVSASKLILGISKSIHGISSSTSVAQYCSKKLSRGCLVLAVNNGKIIFEKEAAGDRSMEELFGGSNFVNPHMINEQPGKDVDPPRRSFHRLLSESKARLSFHNVNGYAAKLSSRFNALKNENCPAQEPVSKPPPTPFATAKDHTSSKSQKRSMSEVQTKDRDSPSGCVPMLIWDLPQRSPRWNLLQRVVFSPKKNSLQGKQKASVAQLVVLLTSRSSKSAVHPDSKQDKSDDKANDPLTELLSLQESYSSVCRMFSHKELMHATSNFSPANIIGEGGSCRVYKGCFSDSKELAVKVMVSSSNLMKDFISEIGIVSNLHHKNVISLTGFCFDNNSFMFVYDFLSRGSLQDNLHGNKVGKNALGWAERYKIAVGVAEALEYLHGSGSTPPVIHRDVKSSNILLSDDFEPQLSDFGLAQLASSSVQNTNNSDLAGTFGYLAPEYFMYGKVDEKMDVYAFGVVLLELLSGRKPVSNACPKGEENLVTWAKPILQGWKLEQLIDPCLGDNYDTVEMERICLAAFLCIRQAPGSRPSIAPVVKLLRGNVETVKWAKLELGAVSDDLDDDDATFDNSDIQSHINLALLDIDDDALSTSSRDYSHDFRTSNTSLEEYLKERWSHSSKFS